MTGIFPVEKCCNRCFPFVQRRRRWPPRHGSLMMLFIFVDAYTYPLFFHCQLFFCSYDGFSLIAREKSDGDGNSPFVLIEDKGGRLICFMVQAQYYLCRPHNLWLPMRTVSEQTIDDLEPEISANCRARPIWISKACLAANSEYHAIPFIPNTSGSTCVRLVGSARSSPGTEHIQQSEKFGQSGGFTSTASEDAKEVLPRSPFTLFDTNRTMYQDRYGTQYLVGG